MKTAEEKVKAFMKDFEQASADDFMQALILVVKEQDRDTRHACAEAVIVAASYGDGDVNDMISVNEAHNACMNVKAV